MKKVLILFIVFVLYFNYGQSQGCIVVRNISGFGQYNLTSNAYSTSEWQLNINNRYFKAYRDYKGTVDQHTAPPNQNIIKSFSTDIAVTHLLNNGWSLDLSLPISANSRSSTLDMGV